MIDLTTMFCGKKFTNPTVLASGILGTTGSLMAKVAKSGAGAVTCKSLSKEPRKGHRNPVVLSWGEGLINAVGLSNPGIEEGIKELKSAKKKTNTPIIASIFAGNIDEFGELASRAMEAEPDFIEVNISCPNVADEHGAPFATDPEKSKEVTQTVKRNSSVPVIIKLSPNVPSISAIAKAVEEGGADAINAINTAGPGMVIDIVSAKPILTNKVGGLSGKAIKPIAVKCVYDIFQSVKIPIIGTGGVTTGEDAIEMIMAGATIVGIGSGVYYRGIDVFKKVCYEMSEFMIEQGYSSLSEIKGLAHKVVE